MLQHSIYQYIVEPILILNLKICIYSFSCFEFLSVFSAVDWATEMVSGL